MKHPKSGGDLILSQNALIASKKDKIYFYLPVLEALNSER